MRANLLRSFYTIAEAYDDLVNAIGHTKGATSVQSGSRIIGSTVSVFDLPRPCLVMVGLTTQDAPRLQGFKESVLTLEVHGDDIFETSAIVDEVECMCNAFQANEHSLLVTVHKLEFDSDAFLATPDPALKMHASQIDLTLTWR